MTLTGPTVDIEAVQTAVRQYFDTIVNQQPGEVGTCKKMVNLGCLNPAWHTLCVVFGKNPGGFLHDMVIKEHKLLSHLTAQGYPIVKTFGDVFNVQPDQERFGIIEEYITGVFIEAKTPAPLKLLLSAALLGIPCKSQEGWLAFHRQEVIDKITSALSTHTAFAAFQDRARHLATAFENLITQLEQNREKIHDLQMVISANGSLTVIDPLEVIQVSMEGKTTSLLEKETLAQPDILRFNQQTQQWLESAKQFCQNAAQCANSLLIIEQCTSFGSAPLVFTSKGDTRGKSRTNQLKSTGATQSQALSPLKNSPY